MKRHCRATVTIDIVLDDPDGAMMPLINAAYAGFVQRHLTTRDADGRVPYANKQDLQIKDGKGSIEWHFLQEWI